jgi:hypothetical protein
MQLALIDGQVRELCGDHRAAGDQRHTPHEGHVVGLALLAAPAADHVVVEVELPVGIGLGDLGGEVDLGLEVAGPVRALGGSAANVITNLSVGGISAGSICGCA